VIPVADQRTHGTTFRALNATTQVAIPGAESAVYDWLVYLRVSWRETFIDSCSQSLRQRLCNGTVSVRLSHLPTAVAAAPCGGFAAVGPTITAATGAAAARRTAANASSVTLSGDVGGWTQTRLVYVCRSYL